MKQTNIDFTTIIPRFDKILQRGLCFGKGDPEGQMCVEAAICVAMNLPFGDKPDCVTPAIRNVKIALNDLNWVDFFSRAKGLRDLGIAQIGSKGVVDGNQFLQLLFEKYTNIIIPTLLIDLFSKDQQIVDIALEMKKVKSKYVFDYTFARIKKICENSLNSVYSYGLLYDVRTAIEYMIVYLKPTEFIESTAGRQIDNLINSLRIVNSCYIKYSNVVQQDKYFLLFAEIMIDVLKELKSPGCDWIK